MTVCAGMSGKRVGCHGRLARCQYSSCEKHAVGSVFVLGLMCSDVFEENTENTQGERVMFWDMK